MIVEELAAKLGLELDEVGFEKAEHVLHKLHLGYAAFGAAAVSGLALAAAGLAKLTADSAVDASRLAQSTGLSLDSVQEFGFAASTAGIGTDEMATALRRLAKTGVKDVRGELLRLSEQFAEMPDGGEKVKLAMEKFGRAGARMIPVLNKGKEAISELMEEAHELGLVFNEEDVEAGKEFKKSLHEIEAVVRGLGYSIGRFVLPAVSKFMHALASVLLGIRKGVPWAQQLGLTFKLLAFVLGGAALAALAANTAAVWAAVTGYAALGYASLVAALSAARAWLIASAPAILLVAAFTALLLVLDDVRGFLQGEDSLLGKIGPQWTAFLDSLTRPNADDPWWLAALKQAVKIATDLEGALGKIGIGRAAGGGSAPTQSDIDAFRQSHRSLYDGSPFSGGAASPDAPTAVAGRSESGAVALTSHVTVQVNGAGDPAAVGDRVADAIREHRDAELRHAKESLP